MKALAIIVLLVLSALFGICATNALGNFIAAVLFMAGMSPIIKAMLK